jgi:putative hemolysin
MGQIVACCRLLPVTCDTLTTSYAAQHYDLSPLQAYEGAMIELGRFCVATPRLDPDVVRLMWAAITTYVDAHDVTLMFGCTSFAGIQPAAHSDALAVLRDHHVGPDCWRPGVKSREAVRFPAHTPCRAGQRKGLREMPSLLRSYLMMGGWVSDHAVVDRHMNTLHVFTAIETLSIPAIRKRLLRALV